ncbi:hypothetical protein A9Q99_04970 [Gammaproteobacteria bacterium 45_16_T64]|nr:hypothetical protein A9Q99_04970 [Gammaproteobacteria bacterium 45_16_T64]
MRAAMRMFGILLVGLLSFGGLLLLGGCQITGTVTMDGEPMEGVVVTLSGDSEQQVITDTSGRYRFDGIDAGTYTVTMMAPDGYSRNPSIDIFKDSDRTNVSDKDFTFDNSTLRSLIDGKAVGLLEDNGIAVWRGLPFAQPPVDALRWKSPQPSQSWSDTYLAIQPSTLCPQFAGMLSDLPQSQYGAIIGDEDCLYLNVWAPSSMPEIADRPVMFWIHGGGNTIGEGIQYNGKHLAERYGVVVVTINYRLGPLGWMRHPALRLTANNALDQTGNYGTLDIIRALTWVKGNIKHFGGDAANVTVFGESAGASNVLTLLASPLATDLFHRAVSQSGSLQWSTIAEAENYNDEVVKGGSRSSREVINDLLVNAGLAGSRSEAKALQISMTDEEVGAFLYQQTPEQLLAVYDGAFAGMFSMPRLFRDDVVLPDETPLSVFASGNYNQVPTILGTNRDESRLFMALDPTYTTVIANLIPIIKNKGDYVLTSKYTSDAWKIRGADEIAEAMQRHQPGSVYVYRFDWDEEIAILGIGADVLLGAAHILEVGFVFADVDTFIVPSYQPFVYTNKNQEGRDFLAGAMSSYWAGFARTGVPGNGFFDEQSTVWQPWSDITDDKTLIFDTEQDQGIVMSDLFFDKESQKISLEAETGFSSVEAHCRVYSELFGSTGFYEERCR